LRTRTRDNADLPRTLIGGSSDFGVAIRATRPRLSTIFGISDAVLAALHGTLAGRHWHRHFCIGDPISCCDVRWRGLAL
jgi:hypothetical protein